MPDKSNRRKQSVNLKTPKETPAITAIEVRGERFEIAPATGYEATVILLAEYSAWFEELKDGVAKARISYNVGKLGRGIMGDWKEVGGVYEMRIDYGPGYRVYFGRHATTVFLVALGGDKSSQQADIAKAVTIWNEVKNGIKEI